FVLRLNKVLELFETVICMEDVPGRGKPHPDGINLALQNLNIGRAYYFGDTLNDIIAAKAAGIIPIGVLPPPLTKDSEYARLLQAEGAYHILESVNELVSLPAVRDD
ncbi:MAG: HAD family hydrolase, partial [Calditrichaeota bacterium]